MFPHTESSSHNFNSRKLELIISTKHLIQMKNELDSIFPNNLQKHSMSFPLVDFNFRKFFGIRNCVHLDGAIRAEDIHTQPKSTEVGE